MNTEEKAILAKLSRRGFWGPPPVQSLPRWLAAVAPYYAVPQLPRPPPMPLLSSGCAGGMAQTETWDPKRYTPVEPGVRTEKVLSTFPSIDTAVNNIRNFTRA